MLRWTSCLLLLMLLTIGLGACDRLENALETTDPSLISMTPVMTAEVTKEQTTQSSAQVPTVSAPTLESPSEIEPPNRVVYSRYTDSGLLVWEPGMDPELLSVREASSPKLSPNGEWVVYRIPTGYPPPTGLYASAIDGDEPLLIYESSVSRTEATVTRSYIHDYAWLSGEDHLLFSVCTVAWEGVEYYGDCQKTSVFLVSLSESKLKLVLETGVVEFSVSLDGNWFAIIGVESIDLYDAQGNIAHADLFTYDEMYQASRQLAFMPSITWLADNSAFMLGLPAVKRDPETNLPTQDSSLTFHRILIDGSVEELATVSGAFIFDTDIDLPQRPTITRFSPDGRYVVALGSTPESPSIKLRLFTISGEQVADIGDVATGDFPIGFGWSLDSSYYAYQLLFGKGYLLGTDGLSQPFSAPNWNVQQLMWLDSRTMMYIAYEINSHTPSIVYLQRIGEEPQPLFSDKMDMFDAQIH